MKKIILLVNLFLVYLFILFLSSAPSTVSSSPLYGFTLTPVATETPIPVEPIAKPNEDEDQPDLPLILPDTGIGTRSLDANRVLLGQVNIPSLNLIVPLQKVSWSGLDWDIGKLGGNAGWLENPAGLELVGNQVIIGHLFLVGNIPGPFVRLAELTEGDIAIVRTGVNQTNYHVRHIFRVDASETKYLAPDLPSQITMITCLPGSYNPQTNQYSRRLVVIFDLVPSQWLRETGRWYRMAVE
jgi:LPXTG-site transpeptidase (sortase) family protein